MSEARAPYNGDPFEELRSLMEPDEVAQLIKLVRLIRTTGGWGEIRLPFRGARLLRATVTLSAVEDKINCNL